MTIIQWLVFFLSPIALFYNIKRTSLIKDKLLLRFPIAFLMIHFIIFYSYVLINGLQFYQLDTMLWSSVLRFHSVATILSLEIYGYYRDLDKVKLDKERDEKLEADKNANS